MPRKSIPKNIKTVNSYFLPSSNYLFNLWNLLYWYFYWKTKQENSIVYSFLNNPYLIGCKVDSHFYNRKSIFDIIHNWKEFPWNKRIHKINFYKCLELYSKIIVDSPKIQKAILKEGFSSHLMMPGVSSSWFKINSPQNKSNKVRVVFFGNLRVNSDVELVEYFIKNNSFEFHFFGMVDSSLKIEIPHQSYHGVCSGNVIAKFLNQKDIILLPYRTDKFTSTIAPAKYFECLATGALIVSRANLTHLPGWDNYVYSINLRDNVYNQVRTLSLMHKKKSQSQVKFAMRNKWTNRFSNLIEYIY